MMSPEKIAIVTGANRGIGFATCKGLCQKFSGIVYLTSKNEEEGRQSVCTLRKLGLNPLYHKLDINDQDSIDQFKKHIKETHGGIDVLINNASIGFRIDLQPRETINTIFFGTLKISESLIPLLRENARIINVSCSSGHLSKIPSQEIRSRFSNPNLTIADLNDLIEEYIRATESKSNMADVVKTWGLSDLVVSKVGVNALTRIHQSILDHEKPLRNILVNSVNPGYITSDKSEEAATAVLNLALESHTLKGKFIWSDGTVIDWLAPSIPEDC